MFQSASVPPQSFDFLNDETKNYKNLKHKAAITLDQCSLNIMFKETILPQNMTEPKMKCRYKMYSTQRQAAVWYLLCF
jgi:hypothetical protein